MTKTRDEIHGFAEVIHPDRLSRIERLERWAAALERRKGAPLRTLHETEFAPRAERLMMRQDNSPLTVAFEDPILRSAGLRDDTFGEAARFFKLSDWELHSILCYCHFGEEVSAGDTAARVRAIQRRGDLLDARIRPATLGGAFLAVGASCLTLAMLVF
jgi:hypothetical protein